jgi:glucose-6-phosphate 1-dehydrogenase
LSEGASAAAMEATISEPGAAGSENPFARDVSHPTPGPTALVIFGARGDLAARKLIPAVYNLLVGGLLPQRLRVIGVSRDEDPEAFTQRARDAIETFSRTELTPDGWDALAPHLESMYGDFGDESMFDRLAAMLRDGDGDEPMQRVFYLAVAPRFFAPIARALARVGLGRDSDPPTRLLVEKPFGEDLRSARELNSELSAAFDESQIFRIDHYLGKETVQNVQVMRFANGILEPVWNRRYVEQVQITVAEDIGIGHRAGFYDSAGAIRDVIQNHAMQLVALTAMEPPVRFEADTIRDEKVKLLRSIRIYDPSEVDEYVVRGQYTRGWVGGEEVAGYLEEDGVAPDSRTETYVAMRVEIDNWRWAGTPFYVRAGKRLPRRATEIAVRFRPVPHLPFGPTDMSGDVEPNELVLSVQPEEGAALRIVAKVPGQTMNVRPVQMEFNYGEAFMSTSPEAYERLLHDALRGDATLFTRADEVEAEWRIVDTILEAWATGGEPAPYEAGSQGPAPADELLAVRGRAWRRI